MERILSVITLEIKTKRFLRGLIILLLALGGVVFCNYMLFNSLGMCRISEVPRMMITMIPLVILIISSFSLTHEFSSKTDKIIFTGIFSRTEIMISKLMSFIFVSTMLFIFYETICVICSTFNLSLLINNLYVFILYTFTLGSFILLVSVITSNFIITGIVGYVLYFDLILELLNQALDSNRSEMVKKIIENMPFYIANTGFYSVSYNLCQSIIMITCGIMFLAISCVIINKKTM